MFTAKELESIKKARAKNERLGKVQKGLYMTEEDLRFATNNEVAKYRAKRLACDTLVEIGCSIGAQTIEFAKICKKVIAIDVDERKIRYAKANMELFKLKNVELICGDGLELDMKKADVIFCDPERPPGEEKRVLSTFKPDIHKLVKKYSAITKNFCIEIPPQTQEIDLDCEKEYVSVNGELNRLNLYMGTLKKSETSAVALPDSARLEGTPKASGLKHKDSGAYLYELDEAVIKAQLVDEIDGKTACLFSGDSRFITSDELIESPFFRNSFKVVAKASSQAEAVQELSKHKFGKVVLRQKVTPKEYWAERKKYENKLTGKKTAHLIVAGNQYLICEKISPD